MHDSFKVELSLPQELILLKLGNCSF